MMGDILTVLVDKDGEKLSGNRNTAVQKESSVLLPSVIAADMPTMGNILTALAQMAVKKLSGNATIDTHTHKTHAIQQVPADPDAPKLG